MAGRNGGQDRDERAYNMKRGIFPPDEVQGAVLRVDGTPLHPGNDDGMKTWFRAGYPTIHQSDRRTQTQSTGIYPVH